MRINAFIKRNENFVIENSGCTITVDPQLKIVITSPEIHKIWGDSGLRFFPIAQRKTIEELQNDALSYFLEYLGAIRKLIKDGEENRADKNALWQSVIERRGIENFKRKDALQDIYGPSLYLYRLGLDGGYRTLKRIQGKHRPLDIAGKFLTLPSVKKEDELRERKILEKWLGRD